MCVCVPFVQAYTASDNRGSKPKLYKEQGTIKSITEKKKKKIPKD